MNGLGLGDEALTGHIAWDPGALPVAKAMAAKMDAPLVAGGISRLVYDCNRPPDAPSAMPTQSETTVIPGNQNLSDAERAERADGIYHPFHRAVEAQIDAARETLALIVTVHSFTPVFHGQKREVEIGLLHGQDDRFAHAMLHATPGDLGLVTRLNEPYSAADGVAHMLDMHGPPNGLPNVMLEIRNDLIRTGDQQRAMAARLVPWIEAVLEGFAA